MSLVQCLIYIYKLIQGLARLCLEKKSVEGNSGMARPRWEKLALRSFRKMVNEYEEKDASMKWGMLVAVNYNKFINKTFQVRFWKNYKKSY